MSERWPDLAGRLAEGRHVLPVRVYYEDTDFSGIVYHASYLRFCERGRSDFLRLAGAHHTELLGGAGGAGGGGEALAFAVRHMVIDFLKPARIDDLLEVKTALGEISGASLTLDQQVERDGKALFTAKVRVVLVNGQGQKGEGHKWFDYGPWIKDPRAPRITSIEHTSGRDTIV
ncbi:MAG TPA: YbgC/FadM family acyl-CoA thioesterase, partial [Hyphomicrobiales bacterium]|nr:YbgC/FadM family acyl-CoA thioesterase [Hyphomicrobiales bacterium]